jgi:hypothetical protein
MGTGLFNAGMNQWFANQNSNANIQPIDMSGFPTRR